MAEIPFVLDEQEMAERQEAVDAYAGESPSHFVNYVEDCVTESDEATVEIRKHMDACWRAYQQDVDFSDKEEWQSQIASNKPFQIVQQSKAVLRKALTDKLDYFDIVEVSEEDKPEAAFWKSALQFWTSEQRANLPLVFVDSAEMSLITGVGKEIIPTWGPNGLQYVSVEPWKIKRDPDAEPRNPWGGNYWIHEEWIDKDELLTKQAEGFYQNVESIEDTEEKLEEEKRRKGMFWQRSKYRKAVMVREFFGKVLSPSGELLLPNANYVTAGRKIIKAPIATPYIHMKWPGVTFSPLPHLLRFGGEGLIKGIKTMWEVMNNLLNLHMDSLNWFVNKVRELDIDQLVDPTDTGVFPGKLVLARGTNGQSAFKEYPGSSGTGDILANYEHLDRETQKGSFVNDFIQGLPGARSEITLGEVELKTQQSLGVFDSIAKDLEAGLINVLWATVEMITLNWTSQDAPTPRMVMPNDQYAAMFEGMEIKIRRELLKINSNIKVASISNMLRRLEFLKRLEAFMDRVAMPPYSAFANPFEAIKEYRDALSLSKTKLLVDDKTGYQLQEMIVAGGGLSGGEDKPGNGKTGTS